MFTLSSTVMYAFFFACGPKQTTVQNAAEPVSSDPVSKQAEPAEETTPEDSTTEDPTANIPVGAPMGSLDKSIIDAKVKEVLPGVKECYNQGLVTQPDLTGKVVIKIVIGKDGTVSSAESVSEKTTLNSTEVVDCVAGKISKVEFPSPKGGGIVIVHYPFVFAQ